MAQGPPPTAVTVVPVRTAEIEDRVQALGSLRANESVDITTTIAEVVVRLNFSDGERVRQGQVLAELSSTEAQALFVEATATFQEAERQFERSQQLAVGGAAAAAQLDEARRNFETAHARRVAIQSRLDQLQIVAPFQGIVGLRNISVGALVQPGDLITTLDDDSVMKLDFSVPSHFLSVLSEGLLIEAQTTAYPDKTFRGTVQSISSRVDPVTRAVTVRARIENDERLLKPGLLMLVELTKNRRRAMLLPEAAILPVSKEAYVFVLDNSTERPIAKRQRVVLGSRQPGEVEIVKGLQGNERVILDGGFKLADGAAVRVVEPFDADEERD